MESEAHRTRGAWGAIGLAVVLTASAMAIGWPPREPGNITAHQDQALAKLLLPSVWNGVAVSAFPMPATVVPTISPVATSELSTDTPTATSFIVPTETPTPTETPGGTFEIDPKAVVYESDDSWAIGQDAARYGPISHDTHEFVGVRDNEDGTLTAFFTDRSDLEDEININATHEELTRMGFTEREINRAIGDIETMDDKRIVDSGPMHFKADPNRPNETTYINSSMLPSSYVAPDGNMRYSLRVGDFTPYKIGDVENNFTGTLLEFAQVEITLKRSGHTNATKAILAVTETAEGQRATVSLENYGYGRTNWKDNMSLTEIPYSIGAEVTDDSRTYRFVALDADGTELYGSRLIEVDDEEAAIFENLDYNHRFTTDAIALRNAGIKNVQVHAETEPDHNFTRMPERNIDGETLKDLGGDTKIIGAFDSDMHIEEMSVIGRRLLDGIIMYNYYNIGGIAANYDSVRRFVEQDSYKTDFAIAADLERWMGPTYTKSVFESDMADFFSMSSAIVPMNGGVIPPPGYVGEL